MSIVPNPRYATAPIELWLLVADKDGVVATKQQLIRWASEADADYDMSRLEQGLNIERNVSSHILVDE